MVVGVVSGVGDRNGSLDWEIVVVVGVKVGVGDRSSS